MSKIAVQKLNLQTFQTLYSTTKNNNKSKSIISYNYFNSHWRYSRSDLVVVLLVLHFQINDSLWTEIFRKLLEWQKCLMTSRDREMTTKLNFSIVLPIRVNYQQKLASLESNSTRDELSCIYFTSSIKLRHMYEVVTIYKIIILVTNNFTFKCCKINRYRKSKIKYWLVFIA